MTDNTVEIRDQLLKITGKTLESVSLTNRGQVLKLTINDIGSYDYDNKDVTMYGSFEIVDTFGSVDIVSSLCISKWCLNNLYVAATVEDDSKPCTCDFSRGQWGCRCGGFQREQDRRRRENAGQ